jgi:hypothetical protein
VQIRAIQGARKLKPCQDHQIIIKDAAETSWRRILRVLGGEKGAVNEARI